MYDKYNMTGHKLLWHLDRLNSWCNGEKIVPLNIQLGITNGCNLNCVYCYGAALMGKVGIKDRTDLDTSIILNLFKDARDFGVRSISLVGEGENTLHPDFYKIIKYAKTIGIDLGIATNGIPLKMYRTEEVLESFVWMRFSVGAANKEKYKLVHGADMFDRFIKVVDSHVKNQTRK
jgi:MoaA/NifB/PqqE/SkfB family radical SAM enzyme